MKRNGFSRQNDRTREIEVKLKPKVKVTFDNFKK